MHSDGAGTKSSLAYAYWKETGNLNVWKEYCSRCHGNEYRRSIIVLELPIT